MLAHFYSRKYCPRLIWGTKAMLSAGRHQLHLRIARPSGCKNGPSLLPSFVKYAHLLPLDSGFSFTIT